MDKERLKLIYKNLKSLLVALEDEIYSDVQSYTKDVQSGPKFEDDDGYTD